MRFFCLGAWFLSRELGVLQALLGSTVMVNVAVLGLVFLKTLRACVFRGAWHGKDGYMYLGR